MRVKLRPPRVSDAGHDGAVMTWEAQLAVVLQGRDTLANAGTAKAQVSVPTPSGGVVAEQLLQVDEKIEVGAAIAVFEVIP